MPNRFSNPDIQYSDTTGLPYSGGLLYFYATGSSTPLNTYSDSGLTIPNANPVVLDSAGRAGNIFLQTLAYKVVLQDVNSNQIWTADPVYTSDYTTIAQFQVYNGNPNGNVAGTAGTGSILSSVVWDYADAVLYVCTTSGNAASAVWTSVTAAFASGIIFSGVITPTILGGSTNNWAPAGFSGAYQVRASASAAYSLTGLAGGAAGRDILLSNIGSYNITLVGNSLSSSAGNRFLFDHPIVLQPTEGLALSYDGTSSGWRSKSPLISNPVAGGFKNLVITVTSNSVTTLTADAVTLEDANSDVYRAVSPSLSLDITTNGANGLDTGSAANTTWYSVWVIFNPATNTVAGLYSTASTLAGLTLPAGYTFGTRLGWVRTDGSAHLLRTLQKGRRAQYVVGTNPTILPVIASGAAGTYSITSPTLATASVTSVVPTATAATIIVCTGPRASYYVAPNTGWGGTNNGGVGTNAAAFPIFNHWSSNGGNGYDGLQQSAEILLEATTIAWSADAAAATINCMGWTDNL